jgi:predicted dehydrogenase
MIASQGASKVSELRVVGTKGDIRLEPAYDYSKDLRSFVTVDGKTDETKISKRDQFAPQLIYFSKCVLEGQAPEPSGVEGRADVRILEAMVRSSETGKKVALSPLEPAARPNGSLEMHIPPVKKVEPVNAPGPSK